MAPETKRDLGRNVLANTARGALGIEQIFALLKGKGCVKTF